MIKIIDRGRDGTLWKTSDGTFIISMLVDHDQNWLNVRIDNAEAERLIWDPVAYDLKINAIHYNRRLFEKDFVNLDDYN